MRTKTCYSGTSIIEDNYFNEMPREWGNLFVISRVHYIEHLHLIKFLGKLPKSPLYLGRVCIVNN